MRYFATGLVVGVLAALVVLPVLRVSAQAGALPTLTPLYSVDQSTIPSGVQERWAVDPEACIAEALAELDEIQAGLDAGEPGPYNIREQMWARIANIPSDAEVRQMAEDAFLVRARLESVGSTPDTDPAVWTAWFRLTATE